MFSGSYLNTDVEFLLKKIDIDFIDIEEKEKLIQTKQKHYSAMISKEEEPTKEYLDIFYKAFELNKLKFAQDILTLTTHLNKKQNIVLISLLRAGTPIGVLVKRTFQNIFRRDEKHYSISIIRDKGIDRVALKYILDKHPNSEFIFIDGWTGKGVINRELKKFIKAFNIKNNSNISDKLYVISDIAYVADYSVNNDDYLIPSSALNSTISGLLSRSILNRDFIKYGDFHGCKYYENFKDIDLSLWFINETMKIVKSIKIDEVELVSKNRIMNTSLNIILNSIKREFDIKDINHIKPGIGETTRVLLRRSPFLIIVKNIESPEIEHILHLSKKKNIKVIENRELPYTSLAIIKNII